MSKERIVQWALSHEYPYCNMNAVRISLPFVILRVPPVVPNRSNRMLIPVQPIPEVRAVHRIVFGGESRQEKFQIF
jgi:hypothetical protein